jgi:hypothetical protein
LTHLECNPQMLRKISNRRVESPDGITSKQFTYKKVSKPLRARMLDEFCQVCGYNRKYAIRLLNGPVPHQGTPRYGAKVILPLTAKAAG